MVDNFFAFANGFRLRFQIILYFCKLLLIKNICFSMKKSKLILFLVALAVISSSCVTTKKVRYLQDMPVEGLPLNESLEATICPYDELRIYVLSNGNNDEELIKPFNVMGTMGQSTANNHRGYLVDANGDIQFPVLGNLHVEGLTRLQLQDTISKHLNDNGYIKNPLVVARFMNFRVFFLSSSGGKVINVNNERCTFLEALAMSGGLDWYTRRDRIGVMREVNGQRVIHYLDPRSTAIFDDEFFLLQQNDIIFTEEATHRFIRESYVNWSFLLTAITTLVSFALLYKKFD